MHEVYETSHINNEDIKLFIKDLQEATYLSHEIKEYEDGETTIFIYDVEDEDMELVKKLENKYLSSQTRMRF
jgi:hypothetical protein